MKQTTSTTMQQQQQQQQEGKGGEEKNRYDQELKVLFPGTVKSPSYTVAVHSILRASNYSESVTNPLPKQVFYPLPTALLHKMVVVW